jgi:hypothetical protein
MRSVINGGQCKIVQMHDYHLRGNGGYVVVSWDCSKLTRSKEVMSGKQYDTAAVVWALFFIACVICFIAGYFHIVFF